MPYTEEELRRMIEYFGLDKEKPKAPKIDPIAPSIKAFQVGKLEDYIQLPQGSDIILVSKYRLGLDDQVEKAAVSLGLSLNNSSQEQNGRGYIGSITWFDALKMNLTLGGFTLNLKQFEDLLELLISNKDIFNGAGSLISREKIRNIYNEITEKRDPWRAEWLDADFKTKGQSKKNLIINYNHKLKNGILVPDNIEDLIWPIKKDCYVNLDFNNQGMPTTESSVQNYVQGSNFYHYYPRDDNNSVAGFRADSGRAGLNCNWTPGYSNAELGVRHAFFHRK